MLLIINHGHFIVNTLDLIVDYISRNSDKAPENLVIESRLDEIGFDSLDMLEMMFELEEKHGIVLPDDAPRPETIGQLVDLLEKHKPAVLNE